MESVNLQQTAKLKQWWKPKATNLLAVLYWVMLLTSLPFGDALFLFFPSVITILGIGSFGHLVNDYYDIAADEKVGKVNRMARLTTRQRRGLLLGALVIALLPWLILPFDRYSILLLLLEFGLLLAYAVPPMRLKERISWPIFTDALYAYAVPAILASYTFYLAGHSFSLLFLLALFFWQVALGSRHFINHLALDRINDLKTETPTLATQKGNTFLHQLGSRLILPLELIGFAALLVYLGYHNWVFSLMAIALFLFVYSIHLILALGRDYPLFPYRFSNIPLDGYYQNYWPIVPLIFLTLGDWRFLIIVIGHLLLFYRVRQRFFFENMVSPKSFLSRYLIYWPIVIICAPFYYFNSLIRGTPIPAFQAAKTTTAPENISPDKEQKQEQSKINMAIVNINKSKYTETFISELIPRLQFNIFYLYGNELPTHDHEDRHFLSNWIKLQRWIHFFESFMNFENNHFQKNSIAAYLQGKQINLVLAEFGPVGVKVFPITRDLGIPLIVYFHGYDVFHKNLLDKHAMAYKDLFQEAKKIIGVSEMMLEALAQLGAPKEKLVHLPAFVNTALFPYTDHSQQPPHFLAVGRFAETKSPHLTILAFHKVLQHIPLARLTMIGKGGGGELFEACLILVKALGIEESVQFKGILNHQQVAEEMRKARIFIQHSLTTPEYGDREGKPVAIMEAMCCGLPVVSTRHSGISELIEHGHNGFLVEEYDIEAMAEYMLLLIRDDKVVQEMGLKASKFIRQDPLISQHVSILEQIIRDSLAQ